MTRRNPLVALAWAVLPHRALVARLAAVLARATIPLDGMTVLRRTGLGPRELPSLLQEVGVESARQRAIRDERWFSGPAPVAVFDLEKARRALAVLGKARAEGRDFQVDARRGAVRIRVGRGWRAYSWRATRDPES
jgi:hypothetical protein